MKITCESKYLAAALATVGRAVSKRNTLPILNNVLLEAETDRVVLKATDLDGWIKAVVPATVETLGSVTVPADALTGYVAKLDNVQVTIEQQEARVLVTAGRSRQLVPFMPAEDFPVLPQVTGTELVMTQQGLREALGLTLFCASTEETRSLLMGVLFEARDDVLKLVTTDTHRMSVLTIPLTTPPDGPVTTIVPAKMLGELHRMLKETDQPVTMRVSDNHAGFKTDDFEMATRVLDGQFPNYEKVLPKAAERTVKFERTAFVEALRRVMLVAHQGCDKVQFDFAPELITMSATASEGGEAHEELPGQLDGGGLQMAFNGAYLVEVLNALKCEQVGLQLQGALNPGMVKPGGDSQFSHVIMPMQI